MKGFTLQLRGRWAHFKRPETNNNPLTHDFITKTAFIGLMGAVLGYDRVQMRRLFPLMSDALLYGVQVAGAVRKESWGFTMRRAGNQADKAPKQMEFLKNPDFIVAIALADDGAEFVGLFNEFIRAVESSEARYTPVFGLHNCPAEVIPLQSGEFTQHDGPFSTLGFVPRRLRLDRSRVDLTRFKIGFERIPTYQNDDLWNIPDRYVEVMYPSAGARIAVDGMHHRFSEGGSWCLV